MLQHNHWGGDGWVRLQNIGARAGPAGPRIDVQPTPYVATEHRHVRQDSLFSAIQCYYLPVTVRLAAVSGIVFQSLTVAAIRGPSLKLLLLIFCVTKFTQNFLRRHLKENDMLKILAAVIRGPLFIRGPYARAYRA